MMRTMMLVLVLAIVMASGCAASTRKTFGLALLGSAAVAGTAFTAHAIYNGSSDETLKIGPNTYTIEGSTKRLWNTWGLQIGTCAIAAIIGGVLVGFYSEPEPIKRAVPPLGPPVEHRPPPPAYAPPDPVDVPASSRKQEMDRE